MSSICLYFVIVFSLFNHTCYTYRILSCICRRISAFLLFTSINHSWRSFSSLALLLPTERVEHIRTTAWALNSSKTYITLNSYILVNGYPIHCTLFRITFPLSFCVFQCVFAPFISTYAVFLHTCFTENTIYLSSVQHGSSCQITVLHLYTDGLELRDLNQSKLRQVNR